MDKFPADFKRDDFLRVIDDRGIERLTFHYTALDGRLKELKIPVTGKDQAENVLTEGERVDGSSLFKGIVDADVSDLYVVPEYKTAFLNPFDKRSLEFFASGELEFFLIYRNDPDIFPLQKQLGYHESSPFRKSGEILDKIVHHISRITGVIKYSHSEVGFIKSIQSEVEEIRGKSAEQLQETDSISDCFWQHGCLLLFAADPSL